MKSITKHVPVTVLPMIALLLCFCAYSWISTDSPVLAVDQAAPSAQERVDLTFHRLRQRTLSGNVYRTKIPGGWLVAVEPSNSRQSTSMAFVPDPTHDWNGKSLSQ